MTRLAFDIGGTFTDFVLEDARGNLHFWKIPTTPSNPAQAVLEGIDQLLKMEGVSSSEIKGFLHATTVATNAIIERKGSRTALIATQGFRDVLIIGRQKRYETYDLHLDKPAPLVPRRDIFEAQERVLHDGTVARALDVSAIDGLIDELGRRGYESVAISLMHSYACPDHERAIAARLAQRLPELAISLSSDISPKFREYERTSTTVANAYIKPIIDRYLAQLSGALSARSAEASLFMMQSNGGLISPELACSYPVRIVESGPAAGVLLCGLVARKEGLEHVLTFDMGGTTAKLGAIDGAEPAIVPTFEVDQVRYKKGSGLPLNIPAVELLEIGAGGGSIAAVDMGLIKVGPESAGAEPGPICYGRGGDRPTVTDANLALGYINPEYFNGGQMKLDRQAAIEGIERCIGKPLQLDVGRAAWGIYTVANANMERAMRIVSVERGRDPRRYGLVAFGGAGPLHVSRLAHALGIPTIVVPLGAGVGSAIGMLDAEAKLDASLTRVTRIDAGSCASIASIYGELEKRVRADVERLGDSASVRWSKFAYMRYAGQGYEIKVDLPAGPFDRKFVEQVEREFHTLYERNYGYRDDSLEIEAVDWYLMATLPRAHRSEPTARIGAATAKPDARRSSRQAYFPELGGYADCAVIDRYSIAPAEVVVGPALIEERECTTVVMPGDTAVVSESGNLIISVNRGRQQ